jgi:hypothetical protein
VEDISAGSSTLLEIDSFGYMFEDSLEYGQETTAAGISLISPNGCGSKKSVQAPAGNLSKSPEAKLRNKLLVGKVAEKYMIGETYSGVKTKTVESKVKELEEKIEKMKTRSENNYDRTVADITSLVGAAILAFQCGAKPRKDAVRFYGDIVLNSFSQSKQPLLWRLAQARRFFLVVLSNYESPHTSALRSIEAGQQTIEAGQQALEAGQQALEAGQQALEAGQQTITLQLGQILEKLDLEKLE